MQRLLPSGKLSEGRRKRWRGRGKLCWLNKRQKPRRKLKQKLKPELGPWQKLKRRQMLMHRLRQRQMPKLRLRLTRQPKSRRKPLLRKLQVQPQQLKKNKRSHRWLSHRMRSQWPTYPHRCCQPMLLQADESLTYNRVLS